MGDSCPFQCNLFVRDHVLPKVKLVQREIFLAQQLCRQCFAPFCRFAHLQLKLSKHGLAVDRSFKLVEEVVDQVSPFLFVLCFSQQVAHQEHLIACGGDLRHEYHVVCRAGGLIFCAVVAVQCMPHLMGQGEHAVQRVLVV